MKDNLNSFFELYGLRTRFEPLPDNDISTSNLEGVLQDLEKKLGIDEEEADK